MDLLKEIRFQRLLSKYEKTFGAEPPITNVTVDEAIAFMSAQLAQCSKTGHAGVLNAAAGQHA